MQKRTKTSLLILISILIIIITFLLDNLFLKAIPTLRISFINPLFIFLGGTIGLLSYLFFLSLLFLHEKKTKFIPYLVIAVVAAIALSYLLKYTILRPRPEIIPLLIKTTSSFPSAHALITASTFFFIKKLKSIKILAFIPAFLITFTGYYNGVHYLSDIMAGILLGIIISYLTLNKLPAIRKKLESLITKS